MEIPFYFRILMSNMEARIKTAMLVEMKLMNKSQDKVSKFGRCFVKSNITEINRSINCKEARIQLYRSFFP